MESTLQVLAGWFVIDLITGVYHYAIDNRKPTDFFIGPQVAEFQEHHDNPRSMEQHGLIERVWLTTAASLVAVYFATLGMPWFWGTVAFGGMICQQAHYWAHCGKRPAVVRVLQQLGILISPEAHGRHHKNFERSFGILNGWSHGFLDLIRGRMYH